jgi:hypothetical protein
LTDEKDVCDGVFRPSAKVKAEIAMTVDGLAKKKVEIENLRGLEQLSAKKKCAERIAVAQGEMIKAENDMLLQFSITDNKCKAMLNKYEKSFGTTLTDLKREFDNTHKLELQPGTPENIRKLRNSNKDKDIDNLKSLKRKLSYNSSEVSVVLSELDYD